MDLRTRGGGSTGVRRRETSSTGPREEGWWTETVKPRGSVGEELGGSCACYRRVRESRKKKEKNPSNPTHPALSILKSLVSSTLCTCTCGVVCRIKAVS